MWAQGLELPLHLSIFSHLEKDKLAIFTYTYQAQVTNI